MGVMTPNNAGLSVICDCTTGAIGFKLACNGESGARDEVGRYVEYTDNFNHIC